MNFPVTRLRRTRQTKTLRSMFQNVYLHPADLILPLFVSESITAKEEIPSMPGVYQYPLKDVSQKTKEIHSTGIPSILLFGIPNEKNPTGSQAYDSSGIVQKAVREIKNSVPDLCVITDVCLCSYTSSGHCGIINQQGVIQNDESCRLLAKVALSHAKAGADIVAPSDMMDGRVGYIRSLLDEEGFEMTPIMSYAVKYASNFYGPFRDAADCAPKFGDRKTYQMNFANSNEAYLEAMTDIEEGADMVIVKPALSYLDVIASLRPLIHHPIIAYSVSGEYSMMKAASMNGWIDYSQVMLETLLSMKRAGADNIITYSALDVLEHL